MSSRLLELPRELRDMIYEFVLVRDVIPIQRAAAALGYIPEESRNRCPEFYRQVTLTYPLRKTCAHRRTWAIPRFDLRVSSSRYDPRDLPTDVQMTYQLEDDYDVPWAYKFDLRLLQTSRQIYEEAREVFYSKNLFSFTDTEAIPTAFAFLCDRPAESLKLISAMEITFDEGSNMIGTTGAHYPIQAKSTDSLVLRYAYHCFPDLCTLLSTPRMQLRRLNLTINSLSQHFVNSLNHHYISAPSSIAASVSWETQKMRSSRPWVASWVQPLLKVKNLEFLEINWTFDRPEACRMADTLSLMKRHMLGEKCNKQTTRACPSENPGFEFTIHYRVVMPDETPADCELSREDLLQSKKDSDDELSKETGLTAWRRHIRDTLDDSGCL
ncbi:zinc ion binding [Pyrenophora seminiperda CCB06]|uniref:Zinc ion binding n=1 Tax=Pyrenophora seminiperda CCB06 TaxID=1302712 RepID=A0A3M7M7Q4_9PLEO|nr:zinc ion binding [Pyrenophora seminiperda CCB06]